jgi:hypothetical protein
VTVTQEVDFGDIQVHAVDAPPLDAAAQERAAYEAEVAAAKSAQSATPVESTTPPSPAESATPPPTAESTTPSPAD